MHNNVESLILGWSNFWHSKVYFEFFGQTKFEFLERVQPKVHQSCTLQAILTSLQVTLPVLQFRDSPLG